MFNFNLFNRPEKNQSEEPHPKTVGEEMRDEAIEKLQRGSQDTKKNLEYRITQAASLITLLKEKLPLARTEQEATLLKIDIAEAETYKAELEKGIKGGTREEPKELHIHTVEHAHVVEEEKKRIEAAKRGIELARKLNDSERVEQLEQHIRNSEEIIATFEIPKEQKNAANESTFDGEAFDRALHATGEGQAADRLDARRSA